MDVPVEATPQDASAALDGGDAVLVDVREPWEYLRSNGRPQSVNVTGGIEAWSQAGLPTE